jgi:ATP-dependent exoDNAse (exonuclease V) beta subunit
MKKNNSFRYPKTQREKIEGKRHYVFDKEKLPSVTTILDATQPAEKRESLLRWKERVGEEAAERIKTSAAERGTAMHKILEKYVLEEGYLDQTDVGKQAHNMAIQIIQSGLSSVTEYYGTECTLYYPGLYAGQTDLVGIHKGQDAIIDFKQSNKPKRPEWIGDYKLQLAAYAMAHNILFNTQITKGVVMMCTVDNYYQEFIIEGEEFKKNMHNFLRRVDEYYRTRPEKTG